MKRRMIFDIETDGLELEDITQIHTIAIHDNKDGKIKSFDLDQTPKGVELLEKADKIVGHNIIDYDLPVINKFHPQADLTDNVYDTLVASRLAWPDIFPLDGKLVEKGRLDKSNMGSYSLEAFGQRLGELKGDFPENTDWEEWSLEMSNYCKQDVKVTHKLYKKIRSKDISNEAMNLEHRVMKIIKRMMDNGVGFDVEGAMGLYTDLKEREEEIKEELREVFPTKIVPKDDPDDPFVPAQDNSRYGYIESAPCVRIEYQDFNPNSRQQIVQRLKDKYDWKPEIYTDKGNPKMTESILDDLPFPETDLLSEYMTISKRLSQLSGGSAAWLKLEEDGRIHGYVNTSGTVTGRMTHSSPNTAQVPANDAPYGERCRQLFIPRDGWKMVGIDASGLELRCLAHYMARYDGGEYAKEVVEGDIHTKNQKAAGLDERGQAKRFIYALIYGAGDETIGDIVTEAGATKGAKRREGKKLKKRFYEQIPALKTLQNKVKNVARGRGYLRGLDGRKLPIRALYKSLNVLLQSAGAIVMKKALVLFEDYIQDQHGLVPDEDYEHVLNVHDEMQLECKPEHTELIGETARQAIIDAGKHFDFRVPLDAEYDIGDNWSETH